MAKPSVPAPIAAARVRHQRPSPDPVFQYGVAYYPEHWSAAERRRDVVRLRDSGINLVRIGEFAWDVWEPRPGHYNFALFDDTIAALGAVGIRTMLGTPTAAPPRWLTRAHPDMLRTAADGGRTGHGGRQHVNPLHPAFRAASRDVVQALADHYASNPHVIGWQIDNEFHCIGATDFSELTATAFQRWLQQRYRTITQLNLAWGTRFNAGTFDRFTDIPLPLCDRADGYPPHPGHLLDFHRFCSDETCARQHEQVAILRAANPTWRLQHNGCFRHLDYWKLAGELDWLGIDLYPSFGGEGEAQRDWAAMKLETARAHSGSFLVPELASGAGGSRARRLPTPAPGQMRLWAWQAIAHGADGIVHFRWRTCRAGAEIHWHGVLDHDNVPRRRFHELRQIATELRDVAPLLAGTVAEVSIGVLIDSDADEAHEAVTTQLPAPRHQAEALLGALLAHHLPAGLVHAADNWSGLRVLFLPSFGHISANLAERLDAFVRRGGILVGTAGMGCRTLSNSATATTPPGSLASLFGATVDEQGVWEKPTASIRLPDGGVIRAPHGYELLRARPSSGTVIAFWTSLIGPAITQNHVGRGQAILIGTWLDRTDARTLVTWLVSHLRWRRLANAPTSVTVRGRREGRRRLYWILNHSDQPATVQRGPIGREVIHLGAPVTYPLEVEPFGIRLIVRD